MRLLHYSDAPLSDLYDRPHKERHGGFAKTSGLWVSVEGPDDWASWCAGENFHLGKFTTEIILCESANVLHLKSARDLDDFTLKYVSGETYERKPDWERVREKYQGIVIAPYQWSRRNSDHTFWYYGWDCASGVIWDVSAIAEARPVSTTAGEETPPMISAPLFAMQR